MNPPCHRCKKSVYPVERLSCLDKQWHKGCFNCETCAMTLSMKTYKGYNKLPYCNTHYPKSTFTAVADTPEHLRLKKNTNIQSNLVYHSEFERAKGKYTTVADDPETLRSKKAQRQASDLEYQKRKGSSGNVVVPMSEERQESYAEQPRQQPSYAEQPRQQSFEQPRQQSFEQQRQQSFEQQRQPSPEPISAPPSAKGKHLAIYDYKAADDDEVSFSEGDVIINGETIDDGWMTGTVQRTGQTGMLPSNYVELM